MANKADGDFLAVAPIESTASAPTYLTISTSDAATSGNLAQGKYWVRLEGVATVMVKTGSAAAFPASGSAAVAGNVSIAHGETYDHKTAGVLHAIGLASGHLTLQPVSDPG